MAPGVAVFKIVDQLLTLAFSSFPYAGLGICCRGCCDTPGLDKAICPPLHLRNVRSTTTGARKTAIANLEHGHENLLSFGNVSFAVNDREVGFVSLRQ